MDCAISFFGDDVMKEIPLTQGKVALVDDSDWEWLSQWRWYANPAKNKWYACRHAPMINGVRYPKLYMHRELLLLTNEDIEVDHRDGNGLNNQRYNLRKTTHQCNQQNVRTTTGTSQYKGVTWHKDRNKWCAQIKTNNKRYHLGRFPQDQEIEAAKAYDAKAVELFGEFACLNFPIEKE